MFLNQIIWMNLYNIYKHLIFTLKSQFKISNLSTLVWFIRQKSQKSIQIDSNYIKNIFVKAFFDQIKITFN